VCAVVVYPVAQDRMEKAQGTTVREAMHEVETCSPDMLLADAADVMLDGKLNRLCVAGLYKP
jgi:CBS domain-containing protein